jgi:hypothetical protein
MRTKPLFVSLDSSCLAREISLAQRSVCYAAPGILKEPADALAALSRAFGPELITVCLDFDERVMRMGFGTLDAVKTLREAGIEVRSTTGLRTGLVIIDDQGCILPSVRLAADALQSVLQAYSDGRTMAVRVTFSGPSEAHGALFGLEPQLRAEILALANALGTERVWVEKVCVATSPALDPEAVKARSDALADLQAMLEAAEIDADLLSGIGAELGELISRAPRDLVECVPDLHAIRKGEIAPIVKRIAPDLVARLAADA